MFSLFSGLRSLVKKQIKNEEIIKGRDIYKMQGCLSSHGQIGLHTLSSVFTLSMLRRLVKQTASHVPILAGKERKKIKNQ